MTEPTVKSGQNFENFVPIRVAAERVNYTSDYVSRLARQGKVEAKRQGKNWLVDLDSLKLFSLQAEAQRRAFNERVKEERKLEQLKRARGNGFANKDTSDQSTLALLESLAVTACVVFIFFLGLHLRGSNLESQNLISGVSHSAKQLSASLSLSKTVGQLSDIGKRLTTLNSDLDTLPSSLTISGQSANLISSNSILSDIWCGFKLLWNKDDSCLKIPTAEYARVVPRENISHEAVPDKVGSSADQNAGVPVSVTYVTNEYITNPVTVVEKEAVDALEKEVVVVKEFIEVQTDATHGSVESLSQGLGESFNTQTLTVSGGTTLSGSLSGTSASLTSLLVNGPATTTSLSLTGALHDSSSSTGTSGFVLQSTGTSTLWVATSTLGLGGGGSGLTSLNGLTDGTQTFATGTATGIGLSIVSSGTTHTFTPTVSSGYIIPLSASTTNWNTFYDTPSNRITAGDGIDWSSNTLNVDNVTAAMLASADFGSFTCNGSTCSLDSSTVSSSTLSAANWQNGYLLMASTTASAGFDWVATSTLGLSGGSGDITAVGSMGSGDAFADSTADDDWFGLGASAGRIAFDDQSTDYVNILSANVGIGTTSPRSLLDVWGDLRVSTSTATTTLFVDVSQNYVGIGTDAPAERLDVDGDVLISRSDSTTAGIRLTGSDGRTFRFSNYGSTAISGTGGIISSVNGPYSTARFAAFNGNQSTNYFSLFDEGVADTMSLRNSTNAQRFNIYNTYTNSTNYEKLGLYWSGNTFNVDTEAAGTGSVRNINLLPGTGNLGVGSSSPNSKLSVAGATYLGGNLTATGTVTFTASSLLNGFLKTNGSGVLSTSTIAVADLSSADFGDFTCNGSACSLDNDTVAAAEIADGDFGAFTFSGGAATLDGSTVSSSTLSALNWTNGYLLSASTTAAAGFDWVATSTLGLPSGTVTSVAMTVPTGLTISGSPITTSGTLALALDTGYIIPLSASTTNWNTFYDTPSNRITAGNALTWSTNTLDFDGGDTPGGELGGTWSSPTIDDSLAVTSWTLTTPLIATSLTVTDDDWIGLGSSAGQIAFDDQTTDYVNILNADVGIGTTTPNKRLTVFETVSDDQFRIAYDDTRYADFQVDSTGDLVVDAQGGDVFLNDENLWVCTGGSCPSTPTPSGTGNLIVESELSVGTSTARSGYSTEIWNNLIVAGGGAPALGTATSTFLGDVSISGKLDVGTIDPVYRIDGTKYATYGLSSIGVKEEAANTFMVSDFNEQTGYYEKQIAWSELKQGNDLWLFYQITDFGVLWEHLTVSLTAGFDGRVFYQKDLKNNALLIQSTAPGEVSARFIANRFDFAKWGNLRSDQDEPFAHFDLESKP